MTLLLRPAASADLPAIRTMLIETWHATYDDILGAAKVAEITARWHSVEKLARELSEAETQPHLNAFLVAEQGGEIVASASVHRQTAEIVELARLYVAPSGQRGGVGTALLRAALSRFPEAAKARLEVEPRNIRAISFYARHGFAPVSSGLACGGDTAAAIAHLVMEAPLPLLRPALDRDAQDLFGLMALCFAEYPGCFVDPHDDMPDLVRPGHWQERIKPGPGGKLRRLGGEFLVLEDATSRVCACVAVDFPEPGGFSSEVDAGSREENPTSENPGFSSEVDAGSREENPTSENPGFSSEVDAGSREENPTKGSITAELHRLYVRPDCRKRGIAVRLVEAAERMARAGGAERMFLWSDTRFADAHRLYARLGYARSEVTRLCGDISNTVEYSFEKDL